MRVLGLGVWNNVYWEKAWSDKFKNDASLRHLEVE